jgi:hypothetical protein
MVDERPTCVRPSRGRHGVAGAKCSRPAKYIIKDRYGDTRFDQPMCGRHAVRYKKEGLGYQVIP